MFGFLKIQNVTLICLIVINLCVFGPVLLRFLWRYNSHRRKLIIKIRYPLSSICYVKMAIVSIFVRFPLIYIAILFEVPTYISKALWCIDALLYPIIYHGMGFALLLRFWLLYFDTNWRSSALSSEWSKIINPEGLKSDWFLSNKKTYGNPGYIRKKLMVFYVLSVTASSLSFYYNVIWGDFKFIVPIFVESFFYVAPTIILIVLWKQLPTFNDYYFIKGTHVFEFCGESRSFARFRDFA